MAWNKVGNLKGGKGDTGQRGPKRFYGSGAPTTAATPNSLPGDEYLDVDTGDLYTLT